MNFVVVRGLLHYLARGGTVVVRGQVQYLVRIGALVVGVVFSC
jgi:hypothetical protein